MTTCIFCAMSGGSDGWEAIEDFGKEKEDWLRQYIPLKNGIPSHDCIAYTLRKVSQPEVPEIEKTTENLCIWLVHGLVATV